MGICARCGKSSRLFSRLCDRCKDVQRAEEIRERAESAERAEAARQRSLLEYEQKRQHFIQSTADAKTSPWA